MVSCSRRGAEALGRPCSVGLTPHSGAACAPGIPVPGEGLGLGHPLGGLRETQAGRPRCPVLLGLILKAWRLQDGSSPLDGAKEVGEESRGSLPGCWAGWLPALAPAPAPARLPGKPLITRSLLSPLLAGRGPSGCPPAVAAQPAGLPAPRRHSCCRRAPALQVLPRPEMPRRPRSPRRRDLHRHRHTCSAEAANNFREGWGSGPGSALTHLATSSRPQEMDRMFLSGLNVAVLNVAAF